MCWSADNTLQKMESALLSNDSKYQTIRRRVWKKSPRTKCDEEYQRVPKSRPQFLVSLGRILCTQQLILSGVPRMSSCSMRLKDLELFLGPLEFQTLSPAWTLSPDLLWWLLLLSPKEEGWSEEALGGGLQDLIMKERSQIYYFNRLFLPSSTFKSSTKMRFTAL